MRKVMKCRVRVGPANFGSGETGWAPREMLNNPGQQSCIHRI